MKKIPIKALGKTIEHAGEVVLVTENLPLETWVDCMVLFVSLETWAEIKDEIEL